MTLSKAMKWCSTCWGNGKITVREQGKPKSSRPCDDCLGTGWVKAK